MRTIFFCCLSGLALFLSCRNSVQNQIKAASGNSLPPDADSARVAISNLNCWIERNHFFVVGICDNLSPYWQKIWLSMAPVDAGGRALMVNGAASATFATFSDAVPPRGRTSFFAEWPITAFSGTPDSCAITGAGAVAVPAGPILIAGEQNGVRMLAPEQVGDSTVNIEKAWMSNVVVDNPLDIQALHPRLELLVYATDERLWFGTVLNPEDSLQRQIVMAERTGPMAPREQRRFGAYIYYENLPQALKDKKIGRVEFQPFEARLE